MTQRGWRLLTYGALVALYLLHNDLWLWNDSRLVLGLPAGLFYHLAFCIVTAAVLGVLVVRAWPPWSDADLAAERQGEPR
ncbi:MAG TPA: DUF3311 domain-containing protein [Thermoanaerobaculia bacterium]|nr:DUF3311 domain-containing protein [Thermoanaerobaculia bacterium]